MSYQGEYNNFYLATIFRQIDNFNYYYLCGYIEMQLATINLIVSMLPKAVRDDLGKFTEALQNSLAIAEKEGLYGRRKCDAFKLSNDAKQKELLIARDRLMLVIEKAGMLKANYGGGYTQLD